MLSLHCGMKDTFLPMLANLLSFYRKKNAPPLQDLVIQKRIVLRTMRHRESMNSHDGGMNAARTQRSICAIIAIHKPFFDYKEVPCGGGGMTNDAGVTLFTQNSHSYEQVRCRDCGKKLGLSGLQIAEATAKKIDSVRLEDERRSKINRLKKTNPVLEALLENQDALIVLSVIIVMMIIFLFAN